MRNKDKDTLYYQRLTSKTEKEIKECGADILKLKQELLEEQELKKQKAEFEQICVQINKYPPAQDTIKLI